MNKQSLHNLTINVDADVSENLLDFSTAVEGAKFDSVRVLFRKQEEELIKLINEFKGGLILGCVAWLTSKPILTALAECQNIQIIVQKEDFLRPDIGVKNSDSWKNELWRLYNSVKCDLVRYDFRSPISSLSVCGDPTVEAIRCVGNHNKDKNPAFPRAHHKFLIFCKLEGENFMPVKLWTGSFNLTKNAMQSFENAVVFSDKTGNNNLFDAFVNEHHQLFALSEPLNWTQTWSTPEFRIGT